MLSLLTSIIVSPVLAALITIYLNRNRVEPLLNLQKKVVNVVKSLDEDETFTVDKKEYGNFINVVYDVLVNMNDNMTPAEYVKYQQALLASIKRSKLSSHYDILGSKVLPMLYQLSDVKIKSHLAIAISAALSACFAIINTIDINKLEVT